MHNQVDLRVQVIRGPVAGEPSAFRHWETVRIMGSNAATETRETWKLGKLMLLLRRFLSLFVF